jgi:hypothetical protein
MKPFDAARGLKSVARETASNRFLANPRPSIIQTGKDV